MVEEGVGAVAVVEAGALVGIYTERDLMTKVVDRDGDADQISVADVMETDVRTIAPDASHGAAAELMITHHCRHLPIVDDDGKVLGMLSIRHLYREQLRRLRGQMNSLQSYLGADGPGG